MRKRSRYPEKQRLLFFGSTVLDFEKVSTMPVPSVLLHSLVLL